MRPYRIGTSDCTRDADWACSTATGSGRSCAGSQSPCSDRGVVRRASRPRSADSPDCSVARAGSMTIAASLTQPAPRSDALKLLRVADRVYARDATVADDERERGAVAVAARKDQPEPAVELDLDRLVRDPAAERSPRTRDTWRSAQRLARGGREAAAVRRPDDIRVEHRDEALEIALADRLRESSYCAIVLVPRGRVAPALALDVAGGARGELPNRLGRAADHLGDIGERQVEYVVQHERRALGGGELLEHGQERIAHRLVQRDPVRRVIRYQWLREPRADIGLAPRPSRAQAVEGDPGHDRRKPAVEVLDRLRIRAVQPQPRLLHDVLRLAHVAQLAVREPQQPRAGPREALGVGHAAIRLQLSVPARIRGAQPVASRSRRFDTRCERASGPSCGARGRSALTPAATARAASISAFVGGSLSATLYVPAGARTAAAMAAAASSIQIVGRYAPGGPSAIEEPPRAASSAARADPLSGPMNSPKRSTTVSPSNSSRALRSAVSAVVVTPPPATGASSSSHASPPSA